jgi:hypothetical protein
METGGDLVDGDVDAAEEVRAIIDKSMSIDKITIDCCTCHILNSD